jgi:hypothetical protein
VVRADRVAATRLLGDIDDGLKLRAYFALVVGSEKARAAARPLQRPLRRGGKSFSGL